MKLKTVNFGPIKKAEIDLNKNLTVFFGDNNSGKTYLAYLIFSIYELEWLPFNKYFESILNNELISKLEIDFEENISTFTKDYNKHISHILSDSIDKIFSSNSIKSGDLKIEFKINNLELLNYIKEREFDVRSSYARYTKNKNSTKFIITKNSDSIPIKEKENFEGITISAISYFVLLIMGNAFISPSERNALNLFYKELLSNKNKFQFQVSNGISDYPFPITRSLIYSETNDIKTDFFNFACEIENDIQTGSINFVGEKKDRIQFTTTNGKELPIHIAGSLIKSISHLILYFKHQAKENDVIIIDEPELNLHPKNQILMARIIGKIINRGFKVLITTHSDYILRELNNLIMLSQVKEIGSTIEELNKTHKQKLSKNMLIKTEDVGAYYFSNKTGNVKRISVNNTGFITKSIDDVIAMQNELMFDLAGRI